MTIVISGRNVNDLYPQALHHLETSGVEEPSRAGTVITVPYPVVSVTMNPMERVLFCPVRDANPFFHLFESLWMLAGRDDGTWLDHFVKDFSSRFGEDDGRIHGAYGHRWRAHFTQDQLIVAINRLRNNPKDRRVVIQMWDPKSDHMVTSGDEPRDVPCNTTIYPRIVNGKLDLSVMVRSNDVIWGAYGANAVHLPALQEYLAAGIGVPVGVFYQFSNNWHAYKNVLEKKLLNNDFTNYPNHYVQGIKPTNMIDKFNMFDEELTNFLFDPEGFVPQHNMWFMLTAHRAWKSFNAYRAGDLKEAIHWADGVAAQDWRKAMMDWLIRRKKEKDAKNA